MKRALPAVAACALLAVAASATAVTMEREEYAAHKDRIEAEHKAALARCKPMNDHGRDLCEVQAVGVRSVARAELDTQYKPGARSTEKLLMARAEAEYALAKVRCEVVAANAREICRKDAKAAFAAARADAKAAKAAAERGERAREAARQRQNARNEQDDALYAAGKERCDALSGQAKDLCLADLKKRFGKI
jgi:hypothetical protein